MKEHLQNNIHLAIHPGFYHSKIEDHHLIIHHCKPAWVIVNDVGFDIIKVLDGKHTVADIVKSIQSQYEIPSDIVARDVKEFLRMFEQSGLLDKGYDGFHEADYGFKTVFLHITDNCNLSCRHCYYIDASSERREHISDETILGFLKDFTLSGGEKVILSGGEPLLRKDVLEKIFKANPQLSYTILTNAILIDDEAASLISPYKVSVQISIDGSTEIIHDNIRGAGAFSRALHGIDVLMRRGLGDRVTTCTTIMKNNISDLKNIIKLAQKIGVRHVRFIPLQKEGRACRSWNDLHEEMLGKECEKFYDYIFEKASKDFPDMIISSGLCGFVLDAQQFNKKGYWCPVENNLVVDSQGNVYPCSLLMNQDYRLGNICYNTIAELRQSSIRADINKALKGRKDVIGKCIQCVWKNFCQSGCMGLAVHGTGSIWESDEYCSYRKKIYKNAIQKIIKGTSNCYLKSEKSECI